MRHHFIISEFFQAYDELTPIHVNGNIHLHHTKITSLGNLESITGHLSLQKTNITSLGDLEWVGFDLVIKSTKIRSLSKLRTVIGIIMCDYGDQFIRLQSENHPERFRIRTV